MQGQGVQLAADAEQEIRPGDAGLLAQNNGALIMPIPMRPGLARISEECGGFQYLVTKLRADIGFDRLDREFIWVCSASTFDQYERLCPIPSRPAVCMPHPAGSVMRI